jgi:hypothetical protein
MLAETDCALGDVQTARKRFQAYLPDLSLDPDALTVMLRLPAAAREPDPMPML